MLSEFRALPDDFLNVLPQTPAPPQRPILLFSSALSHLVIVRTFLEREVKRKSESSEKLRRYTHPPTWKCGLPRRWRFQAVKNQTKRGSPNFWFISLKGRSKPPLNENPNEKSRFAQKISWVKAEVTFRSEGWISFKGTFLPYRSGYFFEIHRIVRGDHPWSEMT